MINARNKITTTVYDSMNRVIETITPDNESTLTDYLLSGAIEKSTNALNEVTTILNDALFQTIGSINALNQQSNRILDALGRAVVNIDAAGKLQTNLFDEIGRSIGNVDGLGNSTRNDYDATGNVIRSTDANGNVTEYQYDNMGRLWVTIDPNGGRVTQTYDNNGNLRTYADPLGNTTTFTYDNQGREIQRTDALGNSLTYTYDTRNLMTSQTDRLGRRKDWTYDDNGSVETETWFTSGSPVNVLTYTYDENGNLLTAADDDGTYTLTYDNQDRLWTQTGLFGVSLTFTYDELSRRNRIEDSFNGVMSSVYDAAGRLEKRQFGGTGQATLTYERDYSDNGELLAARRYSDLTSTNLIGSTTYGYDAAYRLISLQHKDGSGSNIAAYTMTFDNGGRITEENRNGTSVTYSYDTRSQLTQAGTTTYSYDSNGNRTMSGYATGGMNQLTNDSTFTYTYDLEGNVSTKSKGTGLEKWYYSYDHNNRLLSVRKTSDGTTDTLTVTYAYDVFGNRVKEDKWSAGPGLVTTKFVYVGQEVYLDLDNSNAVLMRYIQGDTADEMIVRIGGNNIVAWFLTDRLGSIRDIVDDTGTLIDSITYDAYGKIAAESNVVNRGRYAWAGMQFDGDTVLYAPVWRPDYDPLIGRPYNTDPILTAAGDPNFYRWVGNNPTNATDPNGLQPNLLEEIGRHTTKSVQGAVNSLVSGADFLSEFAVLTEIYENNQLGPARFAGLALRKRQISSKQQGVNGTLSILDSGNLPAKRNGWSESRLNGPTIVYQGDGAQNISFVQIVVAIGEYRRGDTWSTIPKDSVRINIVSKTNLIPNGEMVLDNLETRNPKMAGYIESGLHGGRGKDSVILHDAPTGSSVFMDAFIRRYRDDNTISEIKSTLQYHTYVVANGEAIARIDWISSTHSIRSGNSFTTLHRPSGGQHKDLLTFGSVHGDASNRNLLPESTLALIRKTEMNSVNQWLGCELKQLSGMGR